MGCAWAAFASYGSMMVASYFVGRSKFPINYNVGKLLFYCAVAGLLYFLGMYCLTPSRPVNYIIRFFIISGFVMLIFRNEGIPLPSRRK